MRTFFRRLWYLAWQRKHDADLAEELEFHRAMKARELEADGAASEEAVFAARRAVGNLTLAREHAHDVWIRPWLRDLLQEPRFACRSLLKSPGVTTTAILLIALVIGGNTTIFTMVHGFLTSPAPGVQGDHLVTLDVLRNGRSLGAGDSYPNYLDYTAESSTVQPLLAFQFELFTLRLHNETYAIRGELTSANYFKTLGVRPVKGRWFTENESRANAPGLVAIISHHLWQAHFQSADDALGQTIVLNGQPATIVGIAPPGFQGPILDERADVWVPLLSYTHVAGTDGTLRDRTNLRLVLIGRLTPGVSLRQAQAEFATISTRLQAAYPHADGQHSVRLVPYSMTAAGNSLMVEAAPRFLAIFSGVTLLTLLIVCANIANLMLARAAVRQREFAVRRSLGASRLRIVRMLGVEALIIALTAWGAACLLAFWASKAVLGLILPTMLGIRLGLDVTPDWRVVGYALALALVAMLAFMIGPALHAWRQDLVPSLKAGGHGVAPARSRLAVTLVVAQLAFSILLLVSASLAYRSLTLIEGRDLGFDQNHLLLATVNTSGIASGHADKLALLDRLRTQLAQIPGVQAVSYAQKVPGQYWAPQIVEIPGLQQPVVANRNDVGPGYLETLDIRPTAGREFTPDDDSRTMPAVLITEDLANVLWPGRPAVGRIMRVGAQHQSVEVLGVVPNARFNGFWAAAHPRFIFFPEALAPVGPGTLTFYIRYRGGFHIIGPAVRRTLMTGDDGLPIGSLRRMSDELDALTQPVRGVTTLLELFALGSLLIAALGQYALVAFDTRRRTREFGVRLALGASPRQVLGLVVRDGLRSTAGGLLVGFALSLAVGLAMGGLLYGVTATDAPTYLGVFLLLGLTSLMACLLPASRAGRIDPAAVLREE